MKKILFIFCVFCTLTSFSQDTDSTYVPKFSDKLNPGGSFGLLFGTETNIDVSPTISYLFNDNLSAGIGVVYNYYAYKPYNYKTNIFGGKLFLNYVVYENIYLHGEYELLNLQSDYFDYAEKHINEDRFYSGSLFVGIGYRQYISQKSFISLMILYDLNVHPNSFHENPLIRAGFNF